MATTFTDLGIPFPLFEAPVEEALEWQGYRKCALCEHEDQPCFEMGFGDDILLDCPGCGSLNGLLAADRKDADCRQCGQRIAFPCSDDDELSVCYLCLRSGRAALTKGTELGMVCWDLARQGLTLGLPGLNRTDFGMVPTDSDWVQACVPREMLYELLRTPNHVSIQGEHWEFCCRQPMIYVGSWERSEFVRRAPDGDGKRFLYQIVRDPMPGLWEDKLHDETGIYVFRCGKCGMLRANWDIA